jgi:cell division protein FtsQ
MRRPLMLALLLALTLLLLASRFFPVIERIHVAGAAHYSEAEVLRLARVRVGDPLLWVTTWRLRGLQDDPWILGARVVRRWPHTLQLEVTERTPALVGDATVYALDGTVLPNARAEETAQAVTLSGWGPDRSHEALEILRLVAELEPQVLSYAPSGFTVSFAESSLFTPDAALLRAHWSAFIEQQAGSVAVYPWGVSVQQ